MKEKSSYSDKEKRSVNFRQVAALPLPAGLSAEGFKRRHPNVSQAAALKVNLVIASSRTDDVLCLPFSSDTDKPQLDTGTQKKRETLRQQALEKLESGVRPSHEDWDSEWDYVDIYFGKELRDWMSFSIQEWTSLMSLLGAETNYLGIDIFEENPDRHLHDLGLLTDHMKGSKFLAMKEAEWEASLGFKNNQEEAAFPPKSLG